ISSSTLQISSSTLPLLLPDKIQRTKVLVECEGESINLSGDLGVVGRVVFSDSPSLLYACIISSAAVYQPTNL
ncbi:DNA-binding protein BIN4, partial [Tanacetum coccineum]